MTIGELIGQILGIILIIGCILNAQFPKRWQMLLGQVFLNILSATNMFLLGQGLTACLPCIVAAVHCGVNVIKDRKGKGTRLGETIFFCSLYPIAWGIGFFISVKSGNASWLDIIPLLALAFFISSVIIPKEQLMRLCTLGNATVYSVYNIIYMNVAVFAHLFTIASIIIALIRYRKTDKNPINTDNTEKT